MINHPTGFDPADYESDEGEVFGDGPPCLQRLLWRYEDDGSTPERNNFLWNVGIYGYRSTGSKEGALRAIRETNARFRDPLSDGELAETLCSGETEKYVDGKYTCKKSPIAAVCDAKLCQRRAYGVSWPTPRKKGPPPLPPLPFELERHVSPGKPPRVRLIFRDGRDMYVDTATLLDRGKLCRAIMDALFMVVVFPKTDEFLELIRHAVERAQKIEAEPRQKSA
jgi:hypothetical protein